MARRPARRAAAPKRRISEDAIHLQVAAFLRLAWPADLPWFHPANGGFRAKRTAGKLKAMGLLAGVPDLAFHLPSGRIAYIELKAADGELSEAQIDFRAACIAHGHGYAIARSLEEVEQILTRWLAKFDRTLRASTVTRAA